jgi:hypothetical protein
MSDASRRRHRHSAAHSASRRRHRRVADMLHAPPTPAMQQPHAQAQQLGGTAHKTCPRSAALLRLALPSPPRWARMRCRARAVRALRRERQALNARPLGAQASALLPFKNPACWQPPSRQQRTHADSARVPHRTAARPHAKTARRGASQPARTADSPPAEGPRVAPRAARGRPQRGRAAALRARTTAPARALRAAARPH